VSTAGRTAARTVQLISGGSGPVRRIGRDNLADLECDPTGHTWA